MLPRPRLLLWQIMGVRVHCGGWDDLFDKGDGGFGCCLSGTRVWRNGAPGPGIAFLGQEAPRPNFLAGLWQRWSSFVLLRAFSFPNMGLLGVGRLPLRTVCSVWSL